MRPRRWTLTLAAALTLSSCGRIAYAPRDVGSADVPSVPHAPGCGSGCLSPPAAPERFGSAPPLSREGNPLSLATNENMLFGAFTQGTAPPFALHLAAFAAGGDRTLDVTLDRDVAANDHALAVLPSGLAVAYVRTVGGSAIETRLGLYTMTGGMLESVSIDTRASVVRGLVVAGDSLGLTWIRGESASPRGASFFQERDAALAPIGTTVTLPAEVVPTSLAFVGGDWFVGASQRDATRASLVRVRDLAITLLPAWPTSCGPSSGAILAVGCSGALACWREGAVCGVTTEVVDRCALLAEDGALSGDAIVLFGGPHPGASTPYAIDVGWSGSQFFVHSEFGDGERFAVIDRNGALVRQSNELTLESQGAQGDVAFVDGCAHAVTVNDALDLLVRRACVAPCM